MRRPRSTPTQVGHTSLVEAEPPPEPPPPEKAAPWMETVYVSPSGRIFLPAGFDFDKGRPRALTPTQVRREPPKPRPHRARVVLGVVSAHQPRVQTLESVAAPVTPPAAPVSSRPARVQTRESVAVPVVTPPVAPVRSRARVQTRESWVVPPHLATR